MEFRAESTHFVPKGRKENFPLIDGKGKCINENEIQFNLPSGNSVESEQGLSLHEAIFLTVGLFFS